MSLSVDICYKIKMKLLTTEKIRSQLLTYITIIVLYFLLIGIVILVLLLAPQYAYWKEMGTEASGASEAGLSSQQNELHLPTEQLPYEIPETGPNEIMETFIPSRRDPFYEIDPRSILIKDGGTLDARRRRRNLGV